LRLKFFIDFDFAPINSFLASDAERGPRHSGQTFGRNVFIAIQTDAICIVRNPVQRIANLPKSVQLPDVALSEAAAKKKATRTKKPSVAATKAGAPREGSKARQVIAMLKREGGATLEEIMSAMGWQKHTTRAMLSAGGSLTKNHGLVVTSEKVGDKRTYSIKA
jgi:hypothetical protein